MKLLTTLFLFLFVSFAFAQDNDTLKKDIQTVNTIEAKTVLNLENAVVISVKGIKTMEEIDIENYNKTSYLKLIATSKKKPKIC